MPRRTPRPKIGSHRLAPPVGAPPSTRPAPAPVDLEKLAECIVEKLRETLALENERIGRA